LGNSEVTGLIIWNLFEKQEQEEYELRVSNVFLFSAKDDLHQLFEI
jgi:hypothetical protein